MTTIIRPTRQDFLSFVEQCGQDRQWVMDTETDGLEVIGHHSKCVAWYVGLMPLGTDAVFILRESEIINWGIKGVLQNLRLIGHNLRFDLHALNLRPTRPWRDTMLALYFNHTTGRRSMDHVAKMYGWDKIPTPDALKQGKIHDVPESDLFKYLADDCVTTAKMYMKLQVEKAKFDYRVDWAVYFMECRGVRLLPDKLQEVSKMLEWKITDAEYQLRLNGFDGNPSSPIQVGNWLSEQGRNLPFTPGGKLSTSKLVLQEMADNGDELTDLILSFRRLIKLRSAFVEPLPKLTQDGILYPRTNITRTKTGRFSCDTPNLQQIPKRGPLGKAIRGCITSAQDTGVTSSDFSQIELRVAAAFAEEEVLLEAFNSDRCPHTEVAAKMLGKVVEDVSPEERYSAKAVNFGILNGMGANRLALALKQDKPTANRFLTEYKKNLPALHEWMEKTWREAERFRIIRTVAGRTRIFSSQEDTRPAVSVVVQGSAAELMRQALVAVSDSNLSPILSVHDEILIPGQCKKKANELSEVMESAANNAYTADFSAVRFPTSATIGETWGDI